MLVSNADAKILKRKLQAEQDRPAAAEAHLLRVACFEVAIRLMSDEVDAYQACPSAKCRRRRGCVGRPFRCSPIIRDRGVKHDITRLIEGLYWTMLQKLANGRSFNDDLDNAPPS